jgi:predicted branched-subunit amino acid permease
VAPFFATAALVLVPWIIILATRLPATHAAPHWNLTWAGFDVALTLLLIAVAAAAWRHSPWLEGAATAAGALLLVDAWFDVTTSSSGTELGVSLTEALLVELPIAILCLLLARDAERVLAGSSAARSLRA